MKNFNRQLVIDYLEWLRSRGVGISTVNQRLADDFVITGESKEILEEKVMPLLETFMSERGLSLSPEKTLITHIDEGFDFLGFNVRKYSGKLLIKPSKKNIKTFLDKVRGIIKRNPSMKQERLIQILNPIIRGWVEYHKYTVSQDAFSKIDHEIWLSLWQWIQRRHRKKRQKMDGKQIFSSDWKSSLDILSSTQEQNNGEWGLDVYTDANSSGYSNKKIH